MKISRRIDIGDDNIKNACDSIKELASSPFVEDATVEFLHSGSAVLNLASSGKAMKGGWARGRIINFVGDGSSGKTLTALELAARCFYTMKGNISRNFPQVSRVKIVYNNGEEVLDFPIELMWGKDFCDGLIRRHSHTIEEFGRDVTRELLAYKPGDFVLYIQDSLDSVSSQAAKERFEKAANSDKDQDGSYGSGPEKARYLSADFFENVCHLMKDKDFTIILISQIREAFGITYGKKYRRNGGKSLDFYTHQVAWFYEQEKLKRTIRGETRVYGIRTLVRFERSKVAKPFREASIVILFDYGIDDIGSSLAYLYGPEKKLLTWDDKEYTRADLISLIESNCLIDELSRKVEEKWAAIEEELKPKRLKKFE